MTQDRGVQKRTLELLYPPDSGYTFQLRGDIVEIYNPAGMLMARKPFSNLVEQHVVEQRSTIGRQAGQAKPASLTPPRPGKRGRGRPPKNVRAG